MTDRHCDPVFSGCCDKKLVKGVKDIFGKTASFFRAVKNQRLSIEVTTETGLQIAKGFQHLVKAPT